MTKKTVLAISGSTRQTSTNHSLIRAIAALSAEELHVIIYNGIANLPHFNPDHDENNVASEVADFKQQLNNAAGIINCTPEYAHGVVGTLKNAIDWTVSTAEFSQKPTMLITASTDGRFAHQALLETLKVIEAKNVENLQLVIQFAKTKISSDNKITDEKTFADVKALVAAFISTMKSVDETGNSTD